MLTLNLMFCFLLRPKKQKNFQKKCLIADFLLKNSPSTAVGGVGGKNRILQKISQIPPLALPDKRCIS